MKESKYTYLLNDEPITIDMKFFHFDEGEFEDNYLIMFKPFMVIVCEGKAVMLSHITYNTFNGRERWIEQITGKEIPPELISDKLKKRLAAEIMLD